MENTKSIVAVSLIFLLSSCVVIPPPVVTGLVLSDTVSYATTDKSLIDAGMSTATRQNCTLSNALKGERVCKTYVDLLLELNCDTYSWDKNNRPYCKD